MQDIIPSVLSVIDKSPKNNNEQGASYEEILNWMKENSEREELTKETLQQHLDTEVSYVKLKKNEAGLYVLAKKRGRPFGTGYLGKRAHKSASLPSIPIQKQPSYQSEKEHGLGKRKRVRKSHSDFEFYDTPVSSTAAQPVNLNTISVPGTDVLCDFCLKTSSCNRKGIFEELLMCKDCPAKAHASCMGYSETLSHRARLSPWQCIDCKTCCLCLDSGNPDDLLFCDACDKGYHIFCHEPAIQKKPKNKWACRSCLDDGVRTEDLISANSDAANDGVSSGSSSNQEFSSNQANSLVSGGALDNSLGTPSTSSSPSQTQMNSPSATKIRPQLPANPSLWSTDQVAQYVQECGFHKEAQTFLDQEIDGKSMLLLMREDVLQNLSFKLGPALKIYEKIRLLQKPNAMRNGKPHRRI